MAISHPILSAYRTALGLTTCQYPSGASTFQQVPTGMRISDPPATDQTWFLLSLRAGLKLEEGYGAALPHYSATLELQVHWNPELDENAIQDVIWLDIEALNQTMLALTNRPVWGAGPYGVVMQVSTATPGSVAYKDGKENDILWKGSFRVDYRISQTLT